MFSLNYRVWEVYSLEPHSDVYCFRLYFKILKLGYYTLRKKKPVGMLQATTILVADGKWKQFVDQVEYWIYNKAWSS